MSLHVYTKIQKEQLKLAHKPFAGGGEGSLYKIEMPKTWANHVVKIYHDNKRTPIRQQKIEYLLKYPPQKMDENAIIWVKDAVYNAQGDFLGFVMPMVKGEKLEILCTSNLPRKLQNTWYRFHPESPYALDLRLKICYNLAAAIHQIHASEKYVLVDLKPDNVIVNPNGLVALVDLDSVEVVENGQKLFDAPVATPEYTPPEYYKKNETDPTQQQAWDRFSLAVIFYKLLTGIHPFAASFRAPYDQETNLAQKIEKGLYAHNPGLSKYLAVQPPLHKKIFQLHQDIQNLFTTCFVAGQTSPQARPTAHEWCSVLMQYLDVNSNRLLPTQAVGILDYNTLAKLQELPQSPSLAMEEWPPKYVMKVDATTVAFEAYGWQKVIRGGCFSVLLVAILLVVLFGVGHYLIATGIALFCWTAALNFWYGSRKDNIGIAATKGYKTQKAIYERQKLIFNGVQVHLEEFYKQLIEDRKELFKEGFGTTGSMNQVLEDEKNRLKVRLQYSDKKAKQLLDSERFEYDSMNKKYLQELHTFAEFNEGVSLNAELAAIDFAEQAELELLQKELNKDLKKESGALQDRVEVVKRALHKKERDTEKRIARYRAHIRKAKQQALKKATLKKQRIIDKKWVGIEQNADRFLHSFKDLILDLLLNKCKIQRITEIAEITKKEIILDTGKKVAIAPLKYYHLNAGLVEWCSLVKVGMDKLTSNEKKIIETPFLKEQASFIKTTNEELSAMQKRAHKELNKLADQIRDINNKLQKSNGAEVAQVKEKYRKSKGILLELNKRKEKEESEIHNRYDEQYQSILAAAQKEADVYNLFVRNSFAKEKNEGTTKAFDLYQTNLKKYQIGLKRLEEEYYRLEQKEEAFSYRDSDYQYYKNFSLVKHLKQTLFLESLDKK